MFSMSLFRCLCAFSKSRYPSLRCFMTTTSIKSPNEDNGSRDEPSPSKYGYPDTYYYTGTPATMFSLPHREDSEGVDVCFLGLPFDFRGTRMPGSRLGPRMIRAQSGYRRNFNYITGVAPFDTLNVADCGDVIFPYPYDIDKMTTLIRERTTSLISTGCKVIAMGGEHTVTYPVLQAVKEKYGPVGLIHVDAHDDTEQKTFLFHGSPFYYAGREGCFDHSRTIQIGLHNGGDLDQEDWSYARKHEMRIVPVQDCWYRSMKPLMAEVREMMGDHPVYLSFDIDAIDPGFAPGTGTPETGGLLPMQAMEIIQGCQGLNLIGCDLVEVSPPLDVGDMTTTLASNLLFEMLCVFPGVHNKGLP